MDRDISNWGWGQLLELPDHLFGRRFPVGCFAIVGGVGSALNISEMALPEKAVIWGVSLCTTTTAADQGRISMALGDHLPATTAEYDSFEQLLPDLGQRTGVRGDIYVYRNLCLAFRTLKVGIDTQGRRLVMRYQQIGVDLNVGQVSLIISSVPRSLPEWFV